LFLCVILIGLCQIWVNARPILSDLGQRPTLYQIWVNGATCFIRSGSTPCQQSKPATHVQIWVNASTGTSDLGQRAANSRNPPRKIRSGSTHQPSCQIWVNGLRTGAQTRKSAPLVRTRRPLRLPRVSPCVANVPVCGVYLGSPTRCVQITLHLTPQRTMPHHGAAVTAARKSAPLVRTRPQRPRIKGGVWIQQQPPCPVNPLPPLRSPPRLCPNCAATTPRHAATMSGRGSHLGDGPPPLQRPRREVGEEAADAAAAAAPHVPVCGICLALPRHPPTRCRYVQCNSGHLFCDACLQALDTTTAVTAPPAGSRSERQPSAIRTLTR